MKDEHIWNLIGRQLAGEATAEERAEIELWHISHPDHALLYQSMKAYWQTQHQVPDSNARRMWQTLEQKIAKKPEKIKINISGQYHLYRIYKVAAAITVFLLAGWLLFRYGQQTLLTATVEENTRGSRSEIVLPDGSTVWLNAQSKLTYHQNFGETSRTVYLSGEAFFEVEKNPAIPFVIYLGEHRIQVLGTSFNVKSYDDEATVETSVVTGKVMFVKETDGAGTKDSVYYVTPDQKLAFFKHSGLVETTQVDSREEMAWIQGKLVFKNQTWDQIARTLERTYDTTIVFEKPSLKNCRLTATFHKKTLKEILELIAMTQDFSYEIHQQVMIKGKGCTYPEPSQ